MENLIKYRDRLKQPINFSNLKKGKVYPTDIDALLEIDNKYLILFEVKYKNTSLSGGQKLALERICNAWNNKNKQAIILVVSHETEVHSDIMLDECIVKKVYYKRKWYNERNKLNVKEAIKILAKKLNINKI